MLHMMPSTGRTDPDAPITVQEPKPVHYDVQDKDFWTHGYNQSWPRVQECDEMPRFVTPPRLAWMEADGQFHWHFTYIKSHVSHTMDGLLLQEQAAVSNSFEQFQQRL